METVEEVKLAQLQDSNRVQVTWLTGKLVGVTTNLDDLCLKI